VVTTEETRPELFLDQIYTKSAAHIQARFARPTRAFYQAFLLALILCLSPAKALAYLSPLVVLIWLIVAARKKTILNRALILLFLALIWIGLWRIFNNEFLLHSALLEIITYSSFVILAVIPTKLLKNPVLGRRIEQIVRWIILIEAGVGLVQVLHAYFQSGSFDMANGDAVAGTITLSLLPDGGLGNPMFAINMGFLLLFLLPSVILKRQGWLVVCFGALMLVLASVIHVLIFMAVSVGIAFVLYRPALPKRVSTILLFSALIVIVVTSYYLLSTNWSTLSTYYTGITNGESPRARAYKAAFGDMITEYPLMVSIGLGPGQFASRAGAIGTGYYFGGPYNPRPLPLLPTGMSPAMEKYMWDLWLESVYGSTHQPFSSWLAIYTEFGMICFLLICATVIWVLLTLLLRAKSKPQKWIAFSCSSSILFLFLLGFQDNYWEVPQAILLGVMLIKVMHGRMSATLENNYVRN